MNKETLKEGGYDYVRFENGCHILKNTGTDKLEKWVANKGHASYGLIFKNTHLEFVSSYVEGNVQ